MNRKRMLKIGLLLLVGASFMACFLSIVMRYDGKNGKTMSTLEISICIFSIIVSLVSISFAYMEMWNELRRIRKQDRSEDSERIREAVFAVTDTNKPVKEKKDNALSLMQYNLENMNEFYVWSQRQAKTAFWCAIAMCFFGFLLLSASIILSGYLKISIEVTIVPAVGGIIIELLATTVMVIYRHSLPQLNHYHMALHEDERFLSSINLIDRFSSRETKDEMLKEIIRSQLSMNVGGFMERCTSNTVDDKDEK